MAESWKIKGNFSQMTWLLFCLPCKLGKFGNEGGRGGKLADKRTGIGEGASPDSSSEFQSHLRRRYSFFGMVWLGFLRICPKAHLLNQDVSHISGTRRHKNRVSKPSQAGRGQSSYCACISEWVELCACQTPCFGAISNYSHFWVDLTASGLTVCVSR